MKYEARALRNTILVNLQTSGLSQKCIGKVVDLTQQMVSNVYKKQAAGLATVQKHNGAKRRLTPLQLLNLPTLLSKGSEHYGFTGDYWTHKRVAYVIQQEYDVTYEVKQAGRILDIINWTRQKPQKKDAKQDLVKVEQWQTQDLAALKKKH